MKIQLTMRVILSGFFVLTFFHFQASAVEPKNPKTLCERYLAEPKQQECEKKIERISPDWYLAATCDKIFDESYFWECVELNTIARFNPNKVGDCQNSSKDYEIVECVKSVAQWAEADGVEFQRSPASLGVQKKSKSKKHKSTH